MKSRRNAYPALQKAESSLAGDTVSTQAVGGGRQQDGYSGEPEKMKSALAHARYLLDSADNGDVRRVEIVANERGLDLLRSDVTPFAEEIRTLQENDVVFYACARSIQRLEEKGVEVILVPDIQQDYTALDRVVMRMQDGWKYEKI